MSNNLYDSLQTTQGITYLDDVIFSNSIIFSSSAVTNQTQVLTPPANFVNPLINTNQGLGAPQLFLFLRNFDINLFSTPHNANFANSLNNPRNWSDSQFLTSANVPASAVGNVQTFQFQGINPYNAKPNILSRIFFFTNANINVTKVEISGDNSTYQNINNPPGVLSSNIIQDYIGVYGSPGAFLPNASTGIFIRITVNNTAASVQTYSFAPFGAFDITEYMLYSIQYQDIAGTYHQLAYIDNKISTQNVPLNMLIQAPVMATTANYGNIVVIPKFAFSPTNADLAFFYTLTATFAYLNIGGVSHE